MSARELLRDYERLLVWRPSDLPPTTVPRHLNALLIRLLMGSAFIGILCWLAFTPNVGEREFRRAQEAMRKARSWRQVQYSPSMQMEAEISCPDAGHWSTRITTENGAASANEFIVLGPDAYARHGSPQQEMEPAWQRSSGEPMRLPCRQLAQEGRGGDLPDFDRLIRTAMISKGDTEIIGGVKCRNWKAQVIPGRYRGMPTEDYVICIGTEDHLPRRVNQRFFFDWNTAIRIEAPPVSSATTDATADGS